MSRSRNSNSIASLWRRLPARFRGMSFSLGMLVLATGSCTPMHMSPTQQFAVAHSPVSPEFALAGAPIEAFDPAVVPEFTGEDALLANAALPFEGLGGPVSPAFTLASTAPQAQGRAQDCLAQAIYYEARSESEDGQRAVAQVVLNRVRHPAWPNSVCGVVYQGPMRAGGGCQFSFTCDNSMRVPPSGASWAQAQRIAAEMLAGRVFAPVGLSTFYHANYVMPGWAPRLLKTATIGAHIFYRLPGASGGAAAFSDRYAGVEPAAIPARAPGGVATAAAPAWPVPTIGAATTSVAATWEAAPTSPSAAPVATTASDDQVRPEYRSSGQWREDAPAAVTGR